MNIKKLDLTKIGSSVISMAALAIKSEEEDANKFADLMEHVDMPEEFDEQQIVIDLLRMSTDEFAEKWFGGRDSVDRFLTNR
ncbi:hypothetical protein [Bacillus nakamurai]|uniref:hypothetical protein n=1 Tax=Bacillus nakamurai TaxID=1793963 RepID=UPI001E5516C0|nr:hypothetical protein [Bacillus nakamurai]MCC9021466.1 hypothetical protein [Bacillus nakamurai]